MAKTSSDYAKAKGKNDLQVMVGFFLIVGSILGYWGYTSNRAATSRMDASGKVASRFINDLSSHNIDDASSLLSAQAKITNPPATIAGLVDTEEQRHGNWEGTAQTAFEQRNLYGLEITKFGYSAKFVGATIPMHITLVQGYSGWQVDSFSFDL